MKPIFCGNFDYDARQSDLERLFRRYGKVDRVDMKTGFAFIYMEDERDAEDAIRGLDRTGFGRKGRRLRVEWTKQERGSRRPSGSKKSSVNSRPAKTLFVINFDPYNTRTRDLERHFDPYGKILNIRIRRNFAFIQYESQEDATRALDATNMSKLMDRVISVEYAVRDDDERRNGYSPDGRRRDRSSERSFDKGRSLSPYRRERGSPDYGRGSSPSAYRRERASPDYGRGPSPSPRRRDRAIPDHGRSRSPGHHQRERTSHDSTHGPSRSPYRSERAAPDYGRGRSLSPGRREKIMPEYADRPDLSPEPKEKAERSEKAIPDYDGRANSSRSLSKSQSPQQRERIMPDYGHERSVSPEQREKANPDYGRDPSRSPPCREYELGPSSQSPQQGERDHHTDYGRHGPSTSPYQRESISPDYGRGPSPNSKREEERDSPNYDGGGGSISPNGRYRSRSPPARERSRS